MSNDDKAFDACRGMRHFNTTAEVFQHPVCKRLSIKAAIDPQPLEPRKRGLKVAQEFLCPIAFATIGGSYLNVQEQPFGIDGSKARASFKFLPNVESTRPPFSVVLTLWLSTRMALGVVSRPSATRTSSRNAAFMCSHCPVIRHSRK